MSYSHTKRRKTIARLKRMDHLRPLAGEKRTPWRKGLEMIAKTKIRRQGGPLPGSLEDLMRGHHENKQR